MYVYRRSTFPVKPSFYTLHPPPWLKTLVPACHQMARATRSLPGNTRRSATLVSPPPFALISTSLTRFIVFIYSCPSSCPVKHRMVYASGFNATFLAAKTLAPFHARKIETSTPSEIDEAYLRSELDVSSVSGSGTPGSGTSTPGGGNDDEKKPFARPRGPKRR